MPYSCGPRNTITSCSALPSVAFGNNNCGYGLGYGSLGFGYGNLGGLSFNDGLYGGSALGLGGTVPAELLGITSGVRPACVNQLPPIELTVQRAPFVVVAPGAIMSASNQRVKVGGVSPCSPEGTGIGGFGGYSGLGNACYDGRGFGGYGLGSLNYGRGGFLGDNRRASVCGIRRTSVCN